LTILLPASLLSASPVVKEL